MDERPKGIGMVDAICRLQIGLSIACRDVLDAFQACP